MGFALLPWTRHLFQVYSIGQWRGNISLDFGNNSLDFGNNSSDFGNSWSVRKDGLEKAEADLNFIRTGQICEIRANAKKKVQYLVLKYRYMQLWEMKISFCFTMHNNLAHHLSLYKSNK